MADKKREVQSEGSVIAMRPGLLSKTLASLIEVRRTTCLEGSPGLGKTSIYKQVVESLSERHDEPWGLIVKHLPTMQPEDFGLPLPNVDKTHIKFIVPDWFPSQDSVNSKDHEGKAKIPTYPQRGLLLFDDRNQAEYPHQKILANIIQERELHGEALAEGWTVASTGNRESDRAGANKVLTHLRNRETVLEFQADLDQWCDWAYKHNVSPEVISFLRFRPDLLTKFEAQARANPTPRAWAEGVSPILGKVPKEAEHPCIAGAVGEGAAAEFIGFLNIYRSLPDIDGIIKNPKKADIPTEPSTMYAVCGALANRAEKKTFKAILQYCERMRPEYSVITVLDSVRKDKSLGSTNEFAQWSVKFQSVISAA